MSTMMNIDQNEINPRTGLPWSDAELNRLQQDDDLFYDDAILREQRRAESDWNAENSQGRTAASMMHALHPDDVRIALTRHKLPPL